MKRKYRKIILACLIIVIGFYFFYTFPRKYNITFHGIKYRLGDISYQEDIVVRIKGWYTKRIFLGNQFKGEICLGDNEFLNVNLDLDEYNSDILMVYKKDIGEFRMYGKIYFSDTFDKVVILLLEPVGKGGAWSSKDGLMISAPAKSREEALNLSRELLRDQIMKYAVSKFK